MIRNDLWQQAGALAERPCNVEAQKSQLLDRSIAVVVGNPRLPGCLSHGDTLEQALAQLIEARQLYIYTLLEDGRDVPEPEQTAESRLQITWLEPELIDEDLWARAETLAARDYLVEFSPETLEDGSEGVLAENPEMPGCMAAGHTQSEALTTLARERHVFIYSLLEAGRPVPAPGDMLKMAQQTSAQAAS